MGIGMQEIAAHEASICAYARSKARRAQLVKRARTILLDKGAIFSFTLDGAAHAHDISTVLDKKGIAVRAGHHCAQPLMDHLDR